MEVFVIKRDGLGEAKMVEFGKLKTGDYVIEKTTGRLIRLAEDAHLCGDATYDGYLSYDQDGNSVFPEQLKN